MSKPFIHSYKRAMLQNAMSYIQLKQKLTVKVFVQKKLTKFVDMVFTFHNDIILICLTTMSCY